MSIVIWANRWPDFKIEEILSPAQLKLFRVKNIFPYSFRALDKLQEFRRFVGKPFLINHGDMQRRGARSTKEVHEINSEIRGANRAWEYSFHLWCAFDISCPQMTPGELYTAALAFGKWGGVGIYNWGIHCDDRDSLIPGTATWDGRYPKVEQ